MAGQISKTKVVAATAQQTNATAISLTYQGGQDASSCVGILWTSDATGATDVLMGSTAASAAQLKVGTTTSIIGSPGKDHVVGTAYFTDGTQQVILDTYV
jgi:hypothetical protein